MRPGSSMQRRTVPVQEAAPDQAPSPNARPAAVIVTLSVAAIVGLSLWYLAQPQPLMVQGEADATRIDIAARVDGRVGQRPVDRGQNVAAGQLPGDDRQSRAADQAAAKPRPARRSRMRRSAAHRGRHARRSHRRSARPRSPRPRRTAQLAAADLRPHQAARRHATSPRCRSSTRRPRRSTSRSAACEQAKLAYDEAVAGYTAEERDVAQANVAKAEAAIATLKAQVDELTVKAPIAAQVYQIGAELGEYRLARRAAAVAGRPQRRLAALRSARGSGQGAQGRRPLQGARARARRPADRRSRSASSRRAANMPDGARRARPATSTSGPSRSAPIRSIAIPELRPGMSVYADWKRRALMSAPRARDCCCVATRELALDVARPRRALAGARRPAHRLRASWR